MGAGARARVRCVREGAGAAPHCVWRGWAGGRREVGSRPLADGRPREGGCRRGGAPPTPRAMEFSRGGMDSAARERMPSLVEQHQARMKAQAEAEARAQEEMAERERERAEKAKGDARERGRGHERERERGSSRKHGKHDRKERRRRERSYSSDSGSEDSRERRRRREKRRRRERERDSRHSRHDSRRYSSDSEDSYDSEDSRERRHRRKSHKSDRRHRHKDSRRERSHKHSKRDRSKERDRGRDAGAGKIADGQYGSRGIIRETDAYGKREEFNAWLTEVKGCNTERVKGAEEKALFREYVEDYNTATLPSEKYYNLEVRVRRTRLCLRAPSVRALCGWSGLQHTLKADHTAPPWRRAHVRARCRARRTRTRTRTRTCTRTWQAWYRSQGGGSGQAAAPMNDEEALRLQKKREREERSKAQVEAIKAAMLAKRGGGEVMEDMRRQEELRQKQAMLFRTGDMEGARKLAERLKPEEAKFDAYTGRYRKKA